MFCMLLRKYLAGEKSWPSASPSMERLAGWLSRPPMRWGQSPPPSGAGSHGPRTNLLLLDGEDRLWTACAGWEA